jgi:hypothetical protein
MNERCMMDYILAPNGVAGVVTRSIGGYTQVWPSGDVGTSKELTTNWITGEEQLAKGANEIILWPLYTPGPGTTECNIKAEFSMSPTGPWFQEPYAVVQGDGKISYIGMVRIIPEDYNIVISIPFLADYVRISVMCVGNPTGFSLGINATIASVM